MDKGHITLVSNNYWTLYKFRYDVIQMLIKEGYKVNLIAKKDSYHKFFSNKKIIKHFISLQERGTNIFYEIKTFREIYRLHKIIKPKIVFNFTLKPNIYSSIATRILGIKTISMITGLGHVFIQNNNLFKYIIIRLLRLSLRKSMEIWFTNNFDREYFNRKKILTNQKSFIIPGAGVNITKKKIFRKNPTHKYNLVMISRLLKEKGVNEFIAAAKFFNDDKDKKFILIGAHNDDEHHINKNLLNKAISNKEIIYHPHRDDIDDFLKNSDCIIHPSFREGMSTILLEAAAFKVPIITTKVPGCIDIIINEDYGFLCDPANSKSLIMKIIEFIKMNEENPKSINEKVDKTFNHVINKFDRKKIIEKFKLTIEQY